jgi:hypothetical protein
MRAVINGNYGGLAMDTLESRVARLEAIESIKQLKARYLDACDRKQPDRVRSCFTDGEVVIDYDRVGVLGSADELEDLFRRYGCEDHVVEMHHAQNPQITLHDETFATGRWGLYYHLIDTRAQAVTQLGGFYEDEYRRQDGDWKISATRFRVTSTQIFDLSEGLARAVFAGSAAPESLDSVANQGGQ